MRSDACKKVMVFGVFDGLHPGHRAFLKQAKRYGKKLIAVVARDNVVKKLKDRIPRESGRKRVAAVKKVREVSLAILGDIKQGSYGVIKKYKPDTICLGYDQDWLKKDIKEKVGRGLLPALKLIQVSSHQPGKLHSSLLRDKINE